MPDRVKKEEGGGWRSAPLTAAGRGEKAFACSTLPLLLPLDIGLRDICLKLVSRILTNLAERRNRAGRRRSCPRLPVRYRTRTAPRPPNKTPTRY